MQLVIEILQSWGMGVLGALVFTLYTVWDKIKASNGFNHNKFFGDNKLFWIVVIVLHLTISVAVVIEPKLANAIQGVGFAIENNLMGYFLLGWFLAGGTNTVKKNKVQSPNTPEIK